MATPNKRRKSDTTNSAASRVIDYVGILAVLSLLLAGGLYAFNKEGASALSLTNVCVTGLLALLAKTGPADSGQPQEVAGPNGGPVPVAEVPKPEGGENPE